jgi:hypothetical protein
MGGKRKAEPNGAYQPSDDEDEVQTTSNKKSKQTAVNTPPKQSTKDLFSDADTKIIEKYLMELGNEYSKIKSTAFNDRRDISHHDINNFVNRTPSLKKIQESNLKKSRNSCVENFRQTNFQERSLIQSNNNHGPTITDIEEDETKRIVKVPTRLSTGMWLIPSEQYLRVSPFFTETPGGYHYCCRYKYD